jgi:hypothetical protein
MEAKKIENTELRDRAYILMREVRLIAESLGCKLTESDFTILDKIDDKVDVIESED